ncbi:MAG TPA: HAMP domain-containing sensor histidine kinase [Micromonosporaceae bacterium]
MRYRLVGTYLVLLALVLLALEVPLAVDVAATRTEEAVIDRFVDAARFASLADPALRTGDVVTLEDELRRYHDLYAIAAVVVDREEQVVVSTGDREVFASVAVRRGLVQALAGERIGARQRVWPWQRDPLLVAVPVTSGGEVVGAVLTLSPTDAVRADIARDWAALFAGGVVAGLVFFTVAVALTRWMLRPVAELDDAAHRISEGALDTRVPAELGPPELRRLGRSFNQMADSVADALDRQRAFVAQASHQLRNPLTALRLRVEDLGDALGGTEREQHRLALEEVDRLAGILDGLLALARAERGPYPVETVDAAAVADERVAAWAPVAARRGSRLYRSGVGQAPVRAVPTAVGQALDALIDNAVKFAGPGASIEVEVCPDGDRVSVRVVDDGPGLSVEERRRATERFWRAPDAQNTDGTGLGLPIAAVLVEASGGVLDLQPVTPRGLAARLLFPAASAARPADGEVTRQGLASR